MKNQIIFRRLLKGIGLPLVCFLSGTVGLWLVVWLMIFKWLGFSGSISPMPIGIWLAIFAGLAYFNTEPTFDLAMQTGVSRRHVFLDLMVIWSGCTLLIAAVLGIWSLLASMPHLFVQDLGYHGSVNSTVLIANGLLVILSLMVAALVGILARLLAMQVTEEHRWWLWLGLFFVVFWLAQSKQSAAVTQKLAQIYWVWPLTLAGALCGLLIYLSHQFQVLESKN